MRLLPKFGRKDPAEAMNDEIAARKRALRDIRTRRRIATPAGRQDIAQPEAAASNRPQPGLGAEPVVFNRQEPQLGAEPVVFQRKTEQMDVPAPDPAVDTPPEFLRKAEPQPASLEELAAIPAAPTAPAAPAAEQPAAAGDGALAGLAPEPALAGGGDAGGDLLDIFREAKTETEKGNLASEVDDIPLDELMGDLVSITSRLGIKHRRPVVKLIPREAIVPENEAVDLEPEHELKIEKIVTVPAPKAEDAGEAIVIEAEPEAEIDLGSLIAAEPEQPPPPAQAPPPSSAPPEARRSAADSPGQAKMPPKRGLDGGVMMHLLLLGLALGAAGLFGASRFQRSSAVADAASSEDVAGMVLAVVYTPRPTVTAVGTKAPTASPTPTPTPSPTDSPTPKPVKTRDPGIPRAYSDYRIEYGDSLTSISIDFGLCPDHLLWANDRDEETPLIAGQWLTIPDAPGILHMVSRSDTLEAIARQYNSTVAAITAVDGNQLQTSDDLIPGDTIFVPNGIPQSALEIGATARRKMSVPSADGYVWPFYGPITTYYGEERPGYTHNALDIGALGHYGASAVAVADGTVVSARNDVDYGNNVIIQHADGTRTRYAHFGRLYVQEGDQVTQGQALGALGCSGTSTGTHLHFELWKNGRPVDPLLYLP